MKVLKTITALFIATIISFTVSAQTSAKPASGSSKTSTTTTQTKSASTTADKPGANDKINKDLKGPNGEVVYTGPKGGDYYINSKTGKKSYIPKKK